MCAKTRGTGRGTGGGIGGGAGWGTGGGTGGGESLKTIGGHPGKLMMGRAWGDSDCVSIAQTYTQASKDLQKFPSEAPQPDKAPGLGLGTVPGCCFLE